MIYLTLVAGAVGIIFAIIQTMYILRQDPGNERIQFIGNAIRDGAIAFLSREYRFLAIFVVVVTILVALLIDFDLSGKIGTTNGAIPGTAISYLIGAIGSALAGFVGMNIAVRANTRTAVKAVQGLHPALRVAFTSGTVMGISVVSIGLIGVSILYIVFQNYTIVAGFGFGASSLSLIHI